MSDHDLPAPEHRRPEGVDDKTVEALGKLSEALEVVEDARGYLYPSTGSPAWPTWPSARPSTCCARPVTTRWPARSSHAWSAAT